MPLIKRYPNRKLYNMEGKRYVTLEDVTEMIRDGMDVQVIDHETGDDLTTLTLTQIILEQEKKQSGFLPRSLLTGLIRTGGDTLDQVVRTVQGSLTRPVGEATEAAKQEAMELVGQTTQSLARLDERLADVLHLLNVPTRRDVQSLQNQVVHLTQQLEELLEQAELEEMESAQPTQMDTTTTGRPTVTQPSDADEGSSTPKSRSA